MTARRDEHMQEPLANIVVIVGPTASGKSGLAVVLAKHFDGEVVSADSRQVYRGLNIGTGKVTESEMDGVPHHLLDVIDPREVYTVTDFVRDADTAIGDIVARGKLPVVAGGTFFYLEALLGMKQAAEVPPNEVLRSELAEKGTEELYALLAERDPAYAEVVDRHNPRRLTRALEVIAALGAVPAPSAERRYNALIIGIDVPLETLREKIGGRLRERFDAGMLEEARQLHESGLSYERMESLGLEYRYMARCLQNELSHGEMVTTLEQKIWQYARRQRTWLRNMEGVQWFSPEQYPEIEKVVENFLSSGGR